MVNGTWEGCEMPSRMSAALRPHRGVMTLAGPPATSGSGARRAYRGSWPFSGGLRTWGSARLLQLRFPPGFPTNGPPAKGRDPNGRSS